MDEQETQGHREAAGGREESFTIGGATYHGPVLSRYGRLRRALDLFRREAGWLTGYLFIVEEHFESRDGSIPEEAVIRYLDEAPAVSADVEAALEEVEHLAAELRRAMAAGMPEAPAPHHACRVAKMSRKVSSADERSYRRGYQHGWQHALGAMLRLLRAGQASEEAYRTCTEFNNGELSGWRFGDCAERQMPPVFGVKTEGPA